MRYAGSKRLRVRSLNGGGAWDDMVDVLEREENRREMRQSHTNGRDGHMIGDSVIDFRRLIDSNRMR